MSRIRPEMADGSVTKNVGDAVSDEVGAGGMDLEGAIEAVVSVADGGTSASVGG